MIFYFRCLSSVTVYMKTKSWQCCGLDTRTHIVKLSQDEQHKCYLFCLKSVIIHQSEGAWPTLGGLFVPFSWWFLVISNSHCTRKGWALSIRWDVLYPSLCKCINKTWQWQPAVCPSTLRFLLGWSQHALLHFAALV